MILSCLIALILSALVGWLLYKADKKRAVPYPRVTAALRATLVFLCLFLLFSPKINKRSTDTQKPIVLLLQDNSQSIKTALGKDDKQYIEQIKSLANKLSDNYRLITWNLNGAVNKDSIDQYNLPNTNLSKAIAEASELYGQQNLSALIVASDGWYNEGENPLYTTLPMNGSLYSIAIGDTAVARDIRIAKTYANKTTSLNSQWEVRADILALRCAGAQQTISLSDASGNVVATAPVNVTGDRFDASVSFSVKANKVGLQQYKLSIPKLGDEQNIANNRASVFVEVMQEKKKILLVAAAPHPDIKAIADAMISLEQYELTIKMANEIPTSFTEYSAIILHQLPSNNTSVSPALLNGKSVWFIAGLQNNYFQTNALQKAVNFGLGIAPGSLEAQYNKSFSTFTLPANIASVTDILPPLNVSSNDLNAQASAQVLFNDAGGKPLWAVLSGNVPVAVTSGEGIWRWRIYEYKNFGTHNVIDECIRQTINFLTANNNVKPFKTELSKYVWSNPEHVFINAFLYNANNEPLNQPDAKILVKDSAGNVRNYNFEKNGNSYRIDLGALPAGTYSYSAQTNFNGKPLSDAGSFVVETTSLESLESGCNYPLMYALAQKNKGHTFNTKNMMNVYDSIKNNNTIKPLLSEHIESADLIDWKWIFFLILLVAVAEWLLRKYWMAM